jgi:EAL domain-containing protein (putative c-di-GMP-specific phosphodiesterase class I)
MQQSPPLPAVERPPFLEHYPKGGAPHRIVLDQFPFRIGRSQTAQWRVYSPKVSKEHAELLKIAGDYYIRDLGSTNGTFVNGKRVEQAILFNGDIIHVAHEEFRFGCDPSKESKSEQKSVEITDPVSSALPVSIVKTTQQLHELLRNGELDVLFQPIVDLETVAPIGFEALGRGRRHDIYNNPQDLFRLAAQCHLAAELSRAFRNKAIEQIHHLPAGCSIFLNIHPTEMFQPGLVGHLAQTRKSFRSDQHMVIEIHESAVTDASSIKRLRDELQELDIGLAFDDFGVGQSRFLELAAATPQYIKLDMNLIRGIQDDKPRQDIVRALHQIVKDRGIELIAEGIETYHEARTCRELGCHLGQGYLFGRPGAVQGL